MPLPSDSGVIFRTTDLAKWGAGKGAPLTKDEVDSNFWLLLGYIATAMEATGTPHEIASVTVVDNQMTVTLDDATTFGPFDLPEAAFRWTGAYVGGFDYKRFDILTAADGAYLVRRDHTAATVFDPAASDMTGALYALLFPYQNIFDIGFYFPGPVGQAVPVGAPMFALLITRDVYLPQNLPGSDARFAVEPADGVWGVDIQKNGVVIGQYTFDPSNSSEPAGFFTFAANVQFSAGDVLEVMPPNAIDSAASSFTMTLQGKKGTF